MKSTYLSHAAIYHHSRCRITTHKKDIPPLWRAHTVAVRLSLWFSDLEQAHGVGGNHQFLVGRNHANSDL